MSAAVAARAATRVAQRRAFSGISPLRSFARSFESHPFERIPKSQTPARGDWGQLLKSRATQSMIFAPAIAGLLGWPLLAQKAIDGHVGQI